MQIYLNTQSYTQPEELRFYPAKVYVVKNIRYVEPEDTLIEKDEFHENLPYWEYDLYEYTPQEYVEVLQNQNDELKTELLDTQMALCDIYEAMEQ